MNKFRMIFHFNNLIWLGLLTYVVVPLFGAKGRRFSKRLNKTWFDSLSIISQGVSEASVDFMNYGYIDTPEVQIEDIQETPRKMYVEVATNGLQEDLKGKSVLEIGCGKGVGGKYIMENIHPQAYTGLDLSDEHIKLAKEKCFENEGLNFIQGDAENLPFEDGKFDLVLNIESSHQYPKIFKFYGEVKRVLKKEGQFMYTDFFDDDEVQKCEEAALKAGLILKQKKEITQNVCWALEKTSNMKAEKIESKSPRFAHRYIKEWAGTVDSPLYKMLKEGKRHYYYYIYTS